MVATGSGNAVVPATAGQIDAMLLAARALMSIAAQSVADIDAGISLPQLKVLVLISSRESLNVNTLAQIMGVHPSNATRACDRLAAAGLLERKELPGNRRNLMLVLTDDGRSIVDSITAQRRSAIAAALDRVPQHQRHGLEAAMLAFAEGAEEHLSASGWKLGWPS